MLNMGKECAIFKTVEKAFLIETFCQHTCENRTVSTIIATWVDSVHIPLWVLILNFFMKNIVWMKDIYMAKTWKCMCVKIMMM